MAVRRSSPEVLRVVMLSAPTSAYVWLLLELNVNEESNWEISTADGKELQADDVETQSI